MCIRDRDYASNMLDIATNKAIQFDKKVKLIQMDAQKLIFKDDSFDKVLCFYSLCSMSDPGNVLHEICRVIKDKGRLVVFDVIKSDIDEIALIQYLFRPIAKKFGAIYLEFSPPYVITYDSYLDLFSILDESNFKLEKSKYMDPLRTIALLAFTINK